MAFKLIISKTIRIIAAFLNVAIALLMALGIWRFVSRDDIYSDPSWLVWLPITIFILIGLPLWVTWTLFSDKSKKLRIVFLALNIFTLLIMLAGIFADQWITASFDEPFSLRSIAKISLLLGAPFLTNTMALLFLLGKKRPPYRP